MSEIRAVLFDADGVLQHTRHGWVEALDAVGGPGFAEAVFTREKPAMRGGASMRACLEAAADVRGVILDVDDVLSLWRRIDIDEDAMEVVADVRARGVVAALATNQQDVRRDVMRHLYDGVFDASFYSCEMGMSKPDAGYFGAALTRLDLQPQQVVFVDDSEPNVVAARAIGIRSVLHDPATGATGLRDELADAGVMRA